MKVVSSLPFSPVYICSAGCREGTLPRKDVKIEENKTERNERNFER